MKALSRSVGDLFSKAIAPAAFVASLVRGRRIFHPVGEVFRASTEPCVGQSHELRNFSKRLSETALVRLSNALWSEGEEYPDILGCAIRFAWEGNATQVSATEQDLLLATFKSVATLPVAPLLTSVHDFARNTYHSVTPYEAGKLGRVYFRLVPEADHKISGKNRWERLEHWVREGDARFRLELRKTLPFSPWRPIASLSLKERLDIDQALLRFSPFHDGLGIRPVGLVNQMRRASYQASQLGRSLAHDQKYRRAS